jgi:hypothetical protein
VSDDLARGIKDFSADTERVRDLAVRLWVPKSALALLLAEKAVMLLALTDGLDISSSSASLKMSGSVAHADSDWV